MCIFVDVREVLHHCLLTNSSSFEMKYDDGIDNMHGESGPPFRHSGTKMADKKNGRQAYTLDKFTSSPNAHELLKHVQDIPHNRLLFGESLATNPSTTSG
jgi:hypothetical protein